MAGQITGREHHRQAVLNGTAPDDNQPYVSRVFYDFSNAALLTIQEDFTLGDMQQIMPPFQSLFVDNSKNGGLLTIYVPITNYTLIIPKNVQGTFPIYSPPGPFKCLVSVPGIIAAPNGVTILFCNFSQPLASWAAI